MMMSRQSQEHNPKYVHFANGFPPKELIPAQVLSSGVNMHGGVFVGLHEEATSKLTKSQRTIPPLAKGRANYFPVKHRVSSSRYRDVANPFDAHKGTEKTGFTPQAIKRHKPKLEKTSVRNEHTATQTLSDPANNPNIPLKLSRQTVCPVSTLLNGNEPIPRSPSEANSRILFDVEKGVIQNELLGIDEVYKKVCNGRMDSLCSLISPVKGKQRVKQVSSMHYIHTSSPLPLNTKPFKTPHLNSKENESELQPEKDGEESENYDQGLKNKLMKQCPHTILVPLPYFTAPSRPPHTAPARFKQSYNRPRIYGTRSSELKHRSGAFSSLSGWSSPSVINFNASDLPHINRPVTRASGPTGSIIGVQNKSQTGKVAIVASVDAMAVTPATPPATAASEFYKHQLGFNNHGAADTNGDNFSPEVDSISSEDIDHNISNKNKFENDRETTKHTGVTGDDYDTSKQEQGDGAIEELSNRISGMNAVVTLNVIDENGSVNDVEIYNHEDRDLQKQEQVSKDIQEAQENYKKRKQEIETLLDEHGNLVHEVNNLSKELQE